MTGTTPVNVGLELNTGSGVAYVDNAMLVMGSVAADYAPLHPADDLARCLRYYERSSWAVNAYMAMGQSYSTTQFAGTLAYSIIKAVTPTCTVTGLPSFTNGTFGVIGSSSWSASASGASNTQYTGSVASGLTAGQVGTLLGGGSGSVLALEANP